MDTINYDVAFKDIWENLWNQCKSVFIFHKDTWTVVYAKNPISSYTGQAVKVNSQKDRIDFIKRFAVPGRWSTVIDAVTGEVYKVMKKGKWMQIPIQSLNGVHQQKFEFDLDGTRYKYHLTIEQLGDIEIVLESGEVFEFRKSVEFR